MNPEVDLRLYGRHLKKIDMTNSAANRPITTKLGTHLQNDMPMTTHRSKSKPEVKFQYGGRPFSETGSSFNCVMDSIPRVGSQFRVGVCYEITLSDRKEDSTVSSIICDR